MKQRLERLMEKNPDTIISLLDSSSDGIAIVDKVNEDYVYIYVNKQGKHYFRTDLINKTLMDVHDDKTASYLIELLNHAKEISTHEIKLHNRKHVISGEITIYPLNDNKSMLVAKNIKYVNQMVELKEKDRELKESEERYKAIVEMSPDAVFIHNEKNKIIYVNQAAVKLLGGTNRAQFIDKDIYQFIHKDSSGLIEDRLQMILETGRKSGPVERRFLKIDGTAFYVELHAGRVMFNGKYAVQTICRDVTERKNHEQQLKEMVYQDQLTKVYNRRYFYQCLEKEIEAVKNEPTKKFGLLFLDLDKFKEINDSLGHQIGDEVLEIFTKRVQTMLRDTDIIARLGGDEFIILMPDISDEENLVKIAERICIHVESPIVLEEHSIEISVSIGISLCPDHGMIAEDLIHYADKALYQAKGILGDRIHLYMPVKD